VSFWNTFLFQSICLPFEQSQMLKTVQHRACTLPALQNHEPANMTSIRYPLCTFLESSWFLELIRPLRWMPFAIYPLTCGVLRYLSFAKWQGGEVIGICRHCLKACFVDMQICRQIPNSSRQSVFSDVCLRCRPNIFVIGRTYDHVICSKPNIITHATRRIWSKNVEVRFRFVSS
jgi:hypothetical protein